MIAVDANLSRVPEEVTIYHSPDADDAFMFYGIISGNVDTPGLTLHSALSDIESLNHRALNGTVDVTAISVHALAYCSEQYAVLRTGASMGGVDYGPRVVTFGNGSAERLWADRGDPLVIACPGELTSATLALKLYLRERNIHGEILQTKFDEVQHLVARGSVAAGVIIHEGQLTLGEHGFEVAEDLGAWWWRSTGLPLPLGVNVVKRTLSQDMIRGVAQALRESILYGLRYRQEALEYALSFGRGLRVAQADQFVGMYVNERTVDLGEEGMKSIRLFLERGAEAGIVPATRDLLFVEG